MMPCLTVTHGTIMPGVNMTSSACNQRRCGGQNHQMQLLPKACGKTFVLKTSHHQQCTKYLDADASNELEVLT